MWKPSPDIKSFSDSLMGFPFSRTVGNKVLLCTNYSVCCILLQKLKYTMYFISFRLKIIPIYLFGTIAKRMPDMRFIGSKGSLAQW